MTADTQAFAGIQNQINSKGIETGEIKSIKKIYKQKELESFKKIYKREKLRN